MAFGKTYKVIKRENEAREKLLVGVNLVGDIVGSTLGPAGKNVIFDRDHSFPVILNDGAEVANQIVLEDEIENLGAQAIINAAYKTKEQKGDGSTTTTVLTQAIIKQVFEKMGDSDTIGAGGNVMAIERELKQAKEAVIQKIRERATPITSQQDLENIIFCSLENKELAEKMAKMVWDIGTEGFISTEEGFKEEVEFETVIGMYLRAKIFDNKFLVSDGLKTDFKDVYVVVLNDDLTDVRQFTAFASHLLELAKGKEEGIPTVAFFANDFSQDVIKAMIHNIAKQTFYAIPVKANMLDDDQKKDVSIYCDTLFVDKTAKMTLENADCTKLKMVGKFIVTAKETILINGQGTKEVMDSRIKEIKEQIEAANVEMVRNKLRRRVASLGSGIGIIKVGATTDLERRYLYRKVKDARGAAMAAREGGWVKGGGLTLKEIAEELPENILTEVLKVPYNLIQKNAGGKLEIPDSVIDPADVEITALENAVSLAGKFITIGTAIARKDVEEDKKREVI